MNFRPSTDQKTYGPYADAFYLWSALPVVITIRWWFFMPDLSFNSSIETILINFTRILFGASNWSRFIRFRWIMARPCRLFQATHWVVLRTKRTEKEVNANSDPFHKVTNCQFIKCSKLCVLTPVLEKDRIPFIKLCQSLKVLNRIIIKRKINAN